jgi:hypothetical protein
MELSYDISPDDFATAAQYYSHHLAPFSKIIGVSRIVFPIASLLFVLSSFLASDPRPMLICTTPILLYVVVFSLLYWPLARFVIRRRASGRLLAPVMGPRKIIATPDSLTEDAPWGSRTIYWTAIRRIASTNDFAILLVPGELIIIPRASVTAGDVDAFLAFATAHLRVADA